MFGADPVIYMKFVFRVLDRDQKGFVKRSYVEKVLKVVYENSISEKQILSQLNEIFSSKQQEDGVGGNSYNTTDAVSNNGQKPHQNQENEKSTMTLAEFEQYPGNTSLLLNWIKAILYTCFIESYYPHKLYQLDKQYSTSCEIKEFISKFDDVKNKLQICYHIRNLYYSKCQQKLVSYGSDNKDYYASAANNYSNRSEMKIDMWLHWMEKSNYINIVVAVSIFNLYLNHIKSSWRCFNNNSVIYCFSKNLLEGNKPNSQ